MSFTPLCGGTSTLCHELFGRTEVRSPLTPTVKPGHAIARSQGFTVPRLHLDEKANLQLTFDFSRKMPRLFSSVGKSSTACALHRGFGRWFPW